MLRSNSSSSLSVHEQDAPYDSPLAALRAVATVHFPCRPFHSSHSSWLHSHSSWLHCLSSPPSWLHCLSSSGSTIAQHTHPSQKPVMTPARNTHIGSSRLRSTGAAALPLCWSRAHNKLSLPRARALMCVQRYLYVCIIVALFSQCILPFPWL